MKIGNWSTNMNLGFGFNDADFSDRVLQIEVVADTLDFDSRGMNSDKENGDETTIIKVGALHVNSLILAAKSPFFYKLFKNGMKESRQRDHVTLRINISEEAALMNILEFMYSNTLRATTTLDLVGVLMVADKFEVTCCMSHCIELLKEKHMSLESALLYLHLPSSLLVGELVQPLVNVTKQYLVARYNDLTKSQEEMMNLPLCAIEVVLNNDDIYVDSEDDVFEFIVKWARAHYPKLEERQGILTERLVKCICFPFMSCPKLKEALVCHDFDHEQVSKLALKALFLKVEVPYLRKIDATKDVATTNFSSLVRVYKYRPFHVVQCQLPQTRCVVYFDLKEEKCKNTNPFEILESPSFRLGGRLFNLFVQHSVIKEQHQFGLFVNMNKDSVSCTLDYEFAVMKKSSKKFEKKVKSKSINYSNLHPCRGCIDLLGIQWTDLTSKDCEYFIDGILHLRVDLTINDIQG